MNTVVCVLKSGLFKPWEHKDYTVEYGPQHVLWLRDQVAARFRLPYRFVCMTDMEVPGVETLPLLDNLPGWWSKMEMFREFNVAAYLDLSTVILGDPSPALFSNTHKFTMAQNMTRRHGVNSGVMAWRGNYRFLYERFMERKDAIMAEFTKARQWGDQDYIKESLNAANGKVEKFSEKWPELVISYKYDWLGRGGITRPGARRRVKLRGEWWKQDRIVKFHGHPKPHQVQEKWIPPIPCAD